MTTLWESSTRSLFVKTVWKDGHRHVLLQGDAEKPGQKSWRDSSKHRITSSKTSVPNRPSAPSLRVPSVKLRPKKMKNSNDTPKAKKQCKKKKRESRVEFEEIEKEPEEFRLKSQYNVNKFRRMSRSYTIDVEDPSKNSILADDYPIGTKLLQTEDSVTTLSERVIMWLDLETQKGSCSDSIANFRNISLVKPRIVTASPITNAEPFPNVFEKPLQRQYTLNNDEDSFMSDSEHDCYSSDESMLKCNGINLEAVKAEQEGEVSTDEEEYFIDSSDNIGHSCCASDKKQLHIFIPNLPHSVVEVDEVSVISGSIHFD